MNSQFQPGTLPGRTLLDPFMFAVVTATLLVFLPYVALHEIQEISWTAELLLAMGILGYSGLRLSWLAAVGKPRFLRITFFAFVYVWVGIAGTAQIATGNYPWPVVHMASDVLPSLLQVYLAMFAFDLGFLSIYWRSRASTAPKLFDRFSLTISDRAVAWFVVAATVMAVLGIAAFGGNVLVTRSEATVAISRFSTETSLSQIAEKFLRVPSLVAFVVVLYNAIVRWKTLSLNRKRFYAWTIVYVSLLLSITNFPPSLARHWLGAVVLTPAFALIPWRRWLAGFWVLALTAGLTVAFPYLDLFRSAKTVSEAIDKLEIGETVLHPLLNKGDYDVWQQTVNGYAYTEARGTQNGKNVLVAAFFWFPRAIWTDKPGGTGATVVKFFGYPFTNLSAPLWMEFNYAFGWLGVGGLMFLYARLLAWGEKLYERGLAENGFGRLSRVLVPYWAGFQIFFLRGDLLNATAYSAFGLLLFVLVALPSRLGDKSARSPLIRFPTPRRRAS